MNAKTSNMTTSDSCGDFLRILLRRPAAVLSATAAVGVFTAGCGGGSAPQQVQQPVAESPATTTNTTGVDAAAANQPSGTKWLGKVPYDVFYDKPLDLVGTPQELGAVPVATVAAPAATPGTAASTGTMNSASTNTASGGADAANTSGGNAAGSWSTAISGEQLDAEAKVIRNRLTQSLQSVSTYNRSIDSIGRDAFTLAALAGVAERYDGDMRWKERAAAIRHLAYSVYENNGGKGRKAFDDTLAPFERLGTILDGGPTDGVDAETEVPFPDYADRSSLMERMKVTSEWLKGTIASADNLKSQQDDVAREAAVLAVIGQIIHLEGYDYHDEKNYQKFLADYTTASIDARDAATESNFDKFQDAMGRIQTSCSNCHSEYAFGTDGL